ncbi:MAG TPA: hypothetical protein VMG14_01000 [Thermoplasmata archaeon]|nr:hypothetical protein [Thermoplasmata archaeon]
MPQVLEDLAELPPGAHGLSFHSDSNEAQDHAVRFLSGAPKEAAASYWVATPEIAERYNERLASDLPERVGCVASLGHEQVEDHEGRLRPVGEVTEFVREHPDGVTAAADTISLFWDLESVPEHLEYEEWFQEQPRDRSRFLCPYDLRRVPADVAPDVLRDLGRHHTHVVLSSSPEPAVRLLQLFVFGTPSELPKQLGSELRWAREHRLVHAAGPDVPFELTEQGRVAVREWGERTTVDW